MAAKHVRDEAAGPADLGPRRGRPRHEERDQWRAQGGRCKRVAGHAYGPLLNHRSNDRDAGRQASEDIAKMVPAADIASLAIRRVVHRFLP
jgi:hypothetical protein